jgi:hypothetical protein
VTVDVIDSCPGWEPILSQLTAAANLSVTSALVTFHHADIVTEYARLLEIFASASLVTMLFTLNELITTYGKVPVTKFLLALIKQLQSGSHILV